MLHVFLANDYSKQKFVSRLKCLAVVGSSVMHKSVANWVSAVLVVIYYYKGYKKYLLFLERIAHFCSDIFSIILQTLFQDSSGQIFWFAEYMHIMAVHVVKLANQFTTCSTLFCIFHWNYITSRCIYIALHSYWFSFSVAL